MKKFLLSLTAAFGGLTLFAQDMPQSASTVYYSTSLEELPQITISYNIALPEELTAEQQKALEQIVRDRLPVKLVDGKCVGTGFTDTPLTPMTPEIQAKIEAMNASGERPESMNWEESAVVAPYDEVDGVAVLMMYDNTYLGGAHGLTTVGYINYSLKENRELKLTEFVDLSSAAAQKAMSRHLTRLFEKEYGMKPTVEAIEASPVWRVDPQGITFIYQSYELGPYSMGQPELTVTYSDLKRISKGLNAAATGSQIVNTGR